MISQLINFISKYSQLDHTLIIDDKMTKNKFGPERQIKSNGKIYI
jgi:hypothetical protein